VRPREHFRIGRRTSAFAALGRRHQRRNRIERVALPGHEYTSAAISLKRKRIDFAVASGRSASRGSGAIRLYNRLRRRSLDFGKTMQLRTIGAIAAAALLLTGCAGPERKFGRGMNNVTEFARMGEIRRSMEQTALWEGSDQAYSVGLMRGINRSLVRSGVGIYEILTFPIPSYDPVFFPEHPVYPDAYKPNFVSDPSWGPDSHLGFAGGDIAPHVPGSRFAIFDY
jgi:putative exosortase-associated protein (TIGR04073 family)